MNNKWRLPTIQELLSIVDYTKYNPATNLEGIESDDYWSSSPFVSGSSDAWGVRFYGGYDYHGTKSRRNYVRYVRTLDDGSLEWDKEDAPHKMNWQEALDYAESLNAEQKKTIALETWLMKNNDGDYIIVEATAAYFEDIYKVKLLSTREIEI